MSTITRELAKLFRKITNSEIDAEGNAHVVLSPADSLLINNARIALASLEAEPVAWLLSGGGAKNNVSFDSGNAYADPLREVTPLYTAPPAPVALTSGYSDFEEIWSSSTHPLTQDDEMKDFAWDIWNACRAVMLQSFGNSEQLNSPVIPDGWVACSERMPEQFKAILAFNEYGEVWSGAYDRYWNFYCDNLLVEHVTHWMPLPAAPQQEVK